MIIIFIICDLSYNYFRRYMSQYISIVYQWRCDVVTNYVIYRIALLLKIVILLKSLYEKSLNCVHIRYKPLFYSVQ